MDATRPTPNAPPRLWSLDVLRGGCALVVFLTHWHLWTAFAPRGLLERFVRALGENCYTVFVTVSWPTGGHHPAVICFFVLSGFCIHYPFAKRARDGQPLAGWSDYFRRRFLRIMPAYWAACALGLAFVAAETFRPSGSPLLAQHALSPVADVAVRLTGTSGLYPHEVFVGNYILNTVAVEIVMYAFYPWFHALAARGHWAGLGVGFAALQVVGLLILRWVTPFWVFNSVFMFGLFWYFGALAAEQFVRHGARIRGSWFLLGWGAFLGLKTVPHFYGLNVLRQAAWALVCTLGILWALRREERHPAWRDRPLVAAMRYSGRISYSLYAIHTPAIMLATWLLLVGFHQEDYLVQLAANLAASAAATLATYYGVERVFYRPRG